MVGGDQLHGVVHACVGKFIVRYAEARLSLCAVVERFLDQINEYAVFFRTVCSDIAIAEIGLAVEDHIGVITYAVHVGYRIAVRVCECSGDGAVHLSHSHIDLNLVIAACSVIIRFGNGVVKSLVVPFTMQLSALSRFIKLIVHADIAIEGDRMASKDGIIRPERFVINHAFI